jgi:hypothetical protein
VHSADIQDRDGGMLVTATLFGLHPFLLKLYADGGYRGPRVRLIQFENFKNAQIRTAQVMADALLKAREA